MRLELAVNILLSSKLSCQTDPCDLNDHHNQFNLSLQRWKRMTTVFVGRMATLTIVVLGISFAIVVTLVLAISHMSAAPEKDRIDGLTYDSIDHAEIRRSWNTFDLIATAIVLGLTLSVYVYFSFWI